MYLTRIGYNRAECRIMDMGDTGKQMVLNLEVQSTHEPGDDRISRGKVSSRHHLMTCPVVPEPLVKVSLFKLDN